MINIILKLHIVFVLLMLALISDLKTYKVKNLITYGFMLLGLGVNFAQEGFSGLYFSFQGLVLPVLCLIILYAAKVVGAGDIKLLCAIGAVMGARFALYATLFSFIFGGIIAFGVILCRHNGAARFKYLIEYVRSCFLTMKLLQYTDFKGKNEEGRFHFSIAILSGTAAVIVLGRFGQ